MLAYRRGLLQHEDPAASVPRVERLDGEVVDEPQVLLERVDGERLADEAAQLLVLVAVGGEQAGGAQDLLARVEEVEADDAVLARQQDLGGVPPRHEHRDPPQHVRLEHLAEPPLPVAHEAQDPRGAREVGDEGESLADHRPTHRARDVPHLLGRADP